MGPMNRWLNRKFGEFLRSRGIEPFDRRRFYGRDGLFTYHTDGFRQKAPFQMAYQRGVQASAGFDPQMEWRVHIALWAAKLALRVPGDFVECGVNAGFVSSAVMTALDWNRLAPARRFHLVDTFAGPPLDQYSAGEVQAGALAKAERAVASGGYVTDLERIRANFAEWPMVRVHPGRVPEVLASVDAAQVAFLHIDMNSAAPERAALEHFWSMLAPGAVVLFDDYCHGGCEAQTEALDAAAKGLDVDIVSLPTGQGLIIV
jgi:Methyltransferase domain